MYMCVACKWLTLTRLCAIHGQTISTEIVEDLDGRSVYVGEKMALKNGGNADSPK